MCILYFLLRVFRNSVALNMLTHIYIYIYIYMKVIVEISDKFLRSLMFHYTSLYVYATVVCKPSAFELWRTFL
jgi:hypothetical protein